MRRRSVLRGLVATGGASALAACLDIQGGEPSIRTGDPTRRPARQHGWNAFLDTDEDGNYNLPNHHVYLSLQYEGADRDADRSILEDALLDLERAYAASNRGLLFTVGYSPEYFERFGESYDADLPPVGPIIPGENVGQDTADIFLHLASDYPSVVLEARQALLGDHQANGQSVTTLDGLVSVESRRTGFIGPGLPAKYNNNLEGIRNGSVDEAAPTFMNFRSGFRMNQATEDDVTLSSGRFAGGTTQHVEALRLNLDKWYQRDLQGQVDRLFEAGRDPETVGQHGEAIGDYSGVEAVDEGTLHEIAEEHGVVGHPQKLARFRVDGRPPILRRDVNSRDNREAGIMFVSLQEAFETFRTMRQAMAGIDLAADTPVSERRENGIRQYIRTRRRGNFLLPPRDQRALP